MITTEELLTAARQAGESARESDGEQALLWAIAHAVCFSGAAICERLDVLIDRADEARLVVRQAERRGS